MTVFYKLIVGFLLLVVSIGASQVVNSSKRTQAGKESKFIAEFNDSEGVMNLLRESAHGKLEKIVTGGIESRSEKDGRVFVTRRYETEIVDLDTSVDYDLLSSVKEKMQEHLKKSGLDFKVANSYHRVFAVDYESRCIIGSVDVRAMFSEDKRYFLFFVFHESYCKNQ